MEIVRRAFEGWYPNASETFARFLDPEFEYRITYGPERGVYSGWETTVAAFDRWQEPFSKYTWRAFDFIDGGDDCVIVPFIEQGLGKASGVEIEQRPAFVCALRNGKIRA